MIKAVFFDLDGTLLPMDEDEFIKIYFKLLAKRLMPLGYNPDDLIKVIWGGTNAMFNNDGSKIIVLKDTNGVYKWEELKEPCNLLSDEEFSLLQKYIPMLSK